MKWFALVSQAVAKLPIERLLIRPTDRKKRLQELQEILNEAHAKPSSTANEVVKETIPKAHLEPREGYISTEETVEYQNREIGKWLLRMQGHCTQKFRIKGKACDCGQSRHLLELESLCEETIAMVDNPDIYYRIIELGRELEPKCRPDIVTTGRYDDEFPTYARKYRDFRKELMGSLEPTALYPSNELEEASMMSQDEKDQG